nr:PREDICTED: cytochrome P450 9e2-like [Megachile rotundata]
MEETQIAITSTSSDLVRDSQFGKMWILIAAVLVFFVYFYHQKYMYFERLGIPYSKPFPILGIFFPILTLQCSLGEAFQRIYNENREAKYLGMFDFLTPSLLLRDLDLIKMIAVKNFDHFTDHDEFIVIDNYRKDHLLNLKGDEWKNLRRVASSFLTASKLRELFPKLQHVAKRTAGHMAALPSGSVEDLWDFVSRYTCDTSAFAMFGLDVDSIVDRKNEFFVKATKLTAFERLTDIKIILTRNFPNFCRLVGIKLMNKATENMFRDVVRSVRDMRDQTGTTRADMLQYMLNTRANAPEKRMSEADMLANLVFFFSANSASTALVMAAILLETAANPDIQKRLQEEIDQVLKNSDNGDVSLEALGEMKYLDAVVNEGLRMYPPLPMVDRKCTKPIELPPALPNAKPIILEEGFNVFIPILALCRDPDLYPEPNRFNPERFYNQNSSPRTALAFGMGPRMCMGNRLSVLLLKIIVFHVLAVCELKTCAKTVLPIRFSPGQVLPISAKSYWVEVHPRNKGIEVKQGNGAVSANS